MTVGGKEETHQDDLANEAIKVPLEVLLVIKNAQNQHGLRHGDYQRYRKKAITTEIASKDVRYLYLPLMCAERAWSYAMELKQLSNTEIRKRFHLIRRMKKAVYYAKMLHELSDDEGYDARTKLEAQAYYSWMAANLNFELQLWDKSYELFSRAKKIYEELAGILIESEAATYSQRANEVAPNIRYCLFNLDESSADVKELMQLKNAPGGSDLLAAKINRTITQLREKQAATLHEVIWLGKKLPIVSEEIRVLVLRYHGLSEELARATDYDSRIDVYDGILMECKDALQILKDSLKSDASASAKNFHSRGESQALDLLSYVSHLKYCITIERNIVMADSLEERMQLPESTGSSKSKNKPTKPDDLVRLYDIALQIDKIYSSTVAKCYHVGLTYVFANKWHEAMALFEKTITRCSDAIERFKECEERKSQLYLQRLERFISMARGQKCVAHAKLLSGDDLEGSTIESIEQLRQQPLSERLDVYYSDPSTLTDKPNLVEFPPQFEPIPCKPLFFDIANNYVEFPSLDHRMEQKKSGGIGGLLYCSNFASIDATVIPVTVKKMISILNIDVMLVHSIRQRHLNESHKALQEKNESMHGDTHELERPFLVFVIQNRTDNEGTCQLPEAQVDRFTLKKSP
ncbi:uncharacterized protein TRIADDRAFT_52953 [Trichoplax adhaerens]|uniref:Signal recognition particle subunit SRP68 n=1 Tax=Trichoplax adhaerens TaxID=10228 RepID=B3RMW7_TRIAD|nr:hypothetical protein TRIADDRAFT_52953 [Trichoplax adhaerens]EDV27923.1 hypothetical protein TRIADDRAFT_52953 [Trichoplax adhaerens]|eukprot:XP_002109757.1 hypothetical protein TRIADDRAFT_52953 [Trichoplax adhaerens]